MSQQVYPQINRVVQTESGALRGVPAGIPQYTVFKGVPYAAPPVGNLRWKEPQPVIPWKGVRDAARFGPIAPQHRNFMGTLYGDEFYRSTEPMDEDCLYLNIWTPSITHDEKLPVLFWIHGGALMGGYGYEPEFDGEAFCREGVILVTINYRLGILGFFNHPDLSRESPHQVSGNYGHLDQVAALKWIRRNIKNFGGDPNNITIFGQSAGAASVQDLLVSPLTRGDIAGVIIQSSASIEKISKVMAPTPLEKAERLGVEYAESLGCSTVEELRELPWKVLDEAIGPQIPPKYYFGTIIDGYFLQHTPSQAYFCGEFPDIPIMVGNTSGEANMFGSGSMPVKEWERLQECLFGNKAQAYMELAQVKEPEDIPRVIKDTHTGMVGNRALCELVLRAGHAPAYLYVFDHDLPGNNDGSFHSSELWYVFGTFERCWRPMTGTDFELSRAMTAYWANFAKRKNPNGEKLPTWKPYTETDRENMLFQEKPHCEQVEENPLQAFVLKYIMED